MDNLVAVFGQVITLCISGIVWTTVAVGLFQLVRGLTHRTRLTWRRPMPKRYAQRAG